MTKIRHLRRGRSARRRGAAVAEFAIVAPLLFMVFMAAIEFGRLNQISNSASFAAYQGCRRAMVPGATATAATNEVKATLSAGLVNTTNATIIINPSAITSSTAAVTVTVDIPMNSNSWTSGVFTRNRTVSRKCTITREEIN